MRVDITGRQVAITPGLRQLIDKRLAKLERVLNDSAVSATVILSKEKYRHNAELVVHAKGDHTLSGIGTGNAWPLAIRQAAEKVEHQAEKLKSKWTKGKRRRGGSRAANAEPANAPSANAEPGPRTAAPRRTVRPARYAVKPMSIDDAALRVESGSDTFVVFRNEDTEVLSIIYRRKDGSLRIIEPD